MIIIKGWITELLSLFVFLRFKNIWDLFFHLQKTGKTSGICASVFTRYIDKRGGYIGLGAKFEGIPYLPHGFHGIFISNNAVIGKNAVIFQDVTIGSVLTVGSDKCGSPTVKDNCYIGAGAKIIGGITIGSNCRIGTNAVVYSSLPDNSVAVCAPTRIIQKDSAPDNRFIIEKNGQAVFWNFEKNCFSKLDAD